RPSTTVAASTNPAGCAMATAGSMQINAAGIPTKDRRAQSLVCAMGRRNALRLLRPAILSMVKSVRSTPAHVAARRETLRRDRRDEDEHVGEHDRDGEEVEHHHDSITVGDQSADERTARRTERLNAEEDADGRPPHVRR